MWVVKHCDCKYTRTFHSLLLINHLCGTVNVLLLEKRSTEEKTCLEIQGECKFQSGHVSMKLCTGMLLVPQCCLYRLEPNWRTCVVCCFLV
jgi:hypothetical protein